MKSRHDPHSPCQPWFPQHPLHQIRTKRETLFRARLCQSRFGQVGSGWPGRFQKAGESDVIQPPSHAGKMEPAIMGHHQRQAIDCGGIAHPVGQFCHKFRYGLLHSRIENVVAPPAGSRFTTPRTAIPANTEQPIGFGRRLVELFLNLSERAVAGDGGHQTQALTLIHTAHHLEHILGSRIESSLERAATIPAGSGVGQCGRPDRTTIAIHSHHRPGRPLRGEPGSLRAGASQKCLPVGHGAPRGRVDPQTSPKTGELRIGNVGIDPPRMRRLRHAIRQGGQLRGTGEDAHPAKQGGSAGRCV